MNCEYVRNYYDVPAQLGRAVMVSAGRGVITEDRGNYIGVTLDKEKPGTVNNYHPTDNVEYLGIGKIRKQTRSQQRYKRYLEYGDCFERFLDFCAWDAEPERSWNNSH